MQKTQPFVLPAVPPVQAAPPFNLVGSLLLAGLTTALVALGAGVVARVLPGWRLGFLVAACFLVAIEAALVRYRMLGGRHLAAGAWRYLAAELFALALLMRLAAILGHSLDTLPERLRLWARSPLAALDSEFLAHLAVGLLVALAVRAGLRGLAALDPRPAARAPEAGLDGDFFRATEARYEHETVAQLASGLTWGGVFALLALAGQVLNVERLGGPALPLAPVAGFAGVAYLICALLLYSRARLGLLRARWQRDETIVDSAVLRRWRWASVGLVLAVALLGLLLPTGYGGGLLDAARGAMLTLINLASLVALFFAALAIGALGLALTIPALILALLTGAAGPPGPGAPVVPKPLPPPPAPLPSEPPLAPGLIFWACVAVLAVYALWIVLRRQGWAVAAAAQLRAGLLAPLLAWLQRLWAGAAGYARIVGDAVAERLRRPEPAPHSTARTRPRQPGPGGLVRFFYSSMLARAARGGLGRRHDETPYEFGAQLREHLPEAAEEIDRLTDSYVATAYGPRPTPPEQASVARRAWQQIRRVMRALRKE